MIFPTVTCNIFLIHRCTLDFIREACDIATPTDQLIAVHCKTGMRARIGCSILKRAGFTKIVNVQGGYEKLVSAGAKLTQPPSDTRFMLFESKKAAPLTASSGKGNQKQGGCCLLI